MAQEYLNLTDITEAEFNRLPTAVKNYNWAVYMATDAYARPLADEAKANLEKFYIEEQRNYSRTGSVDFKDTIIKRMIETSDPDTYDIEALYTMTGEELLELEGGLA